MHDIGHAVCFLSFCLPCVQFGYNKQKLKALRAGNGSGCVASATDLLFLLPLGRARIHMNFRARGWQLNQIESCSDCCTVPCCSPCTAILEATLLVLSLFETTLHTTTRDRRTTTTYVLRFSREFLIRSSCCGSCTDHHAVHIRSAPQCTTTAFTCNPHSSSCSSLLQYLPTYEWTSSASSRSSLCWTINVLEITVYSTCNCYVCTCLSYVFVEAFLL